MVYDLCLLHSGGLGEEEGFNLREKEAMGVNKAVCWRENIMAANPNVFLGGSNNAEGDTDPDVELFYSCVIWVSFLHQFVFNLMPGDILFYLSFVLKDECVGKFFLRDLRSLAGSSMIDKRFPIN